MKLAGEKLGLSLTASTVKVKFFIVDSSLSETAIEISISKFSANSSSTNCPSDNCKILFSIFNQSGNKIEVICKSEISLSMSLI